MTCGLGWGVSRRLVGGYARWARRRTRDLPLWILCGPSLLGIIIVDALCLALGVFLALPTAADAPAQFARAVESGSLAVSEQRAYQALRVEADRQKLEALRAKAGSYTLGAGSSHSNGGRRSCGGVRCRRTESRRSWTWTRV